MKGKIIYLAIGIMLGIGLAYLFISPAVNNEKVAVSNKSIVISKQNITSDKEYELLNPLVQCLNFKTLYYSPMLGFKSKLISFIDSVLKEDPTLEMSFYFRDLTNGSEVTYNDKTKFTPASLMKVIVLMTLLKEEDRKKGSLDFKIRYKGDLIKNVENKVDYKFVKNKLYTLRELAHIMIHYSDNLSTKMIIDFVGLNKVEITQQALNIHVNSASIADERVIGVRSYATTFRSLYNASYLSRDMSEYALSLLDSVQYGYGIREAIPKEVGVAHKFGERYLGSTDNIKTQSIQLHHFGIVYREGKPYLIGFMSKGKNMDQMKKNILTITKMVDSEIVERLDQIKREGLPSDAL